jgi:hypothetical protein
LRYRTLLEGKRILMTTYAIRRGFRLLDPKSFPSGKYLYAAALDGMERFGAPVTLEQIKCDLPVVDYMITGTGAIEVRNPHKPTCGIVWDLSDPRMFETIPPLQELKIMEPGLPPLVTTA